MAVQTESGTQTALTSRQAWQALQSHYEQVSKRHLRDLFAEDKDRGTKMAIEEAGLYFDYSKNRITEETLKLLIQLAEECGLKERIEAMFRGDKINITEKRAVLHVALRAPKGTIDCRGRRERRARSSRGARQDGGLRRARPRRRVEGSHRQAHSQRHQHRDRRLGSRAGNGLRSAEALQRPRHDVPLRFQCRWHGFRRSGPRISIPARRCSSSRRRRSPRWKR